MNILHLINKPAYTLEVFQHCCQSVRQGDGMLFIEDGVLSLQRATTVKKLQKLTGQCTVYCLTADCEARGIMSRLPNFVMLVTIDGFVDLTADFSKTISWF